MVPGQDLVAVGTIGEPGMRLLSASPALDLKRRFPAWFLKRARRFPVQDFPRDLAGWERICPEPCSVTACQTVGEGGILAALWKMSSDYRAGIRFSLRSVPIRQEVVEACEAWGINPYRLWSDCAVLAASHGGDVVEALREAGIQASVIGKVTDRPSCEIFHGVEVAYLERPAQDEVKRILDTGVTRL